MMGHFQLKTLLLYFSLQKLQFEANKVENFKSLNQDGLEKILFLELNLLDTEKCPRKEHLVRHTPCLKMRSMSVSISTEKKLIEQKKRKQEPKEKGCGEEKAKACNLFPNNLLAYYYNLNKLIQ